MKFHTEPVNIERSGISTETAFTIKTTAKAFDILSSGLYTDGIRAIIRELSCNAYDAHIAANKADVPFEIHLPNELEPFFSVKDWGTGLSDEQIQGSLVPVMTTDENGNEIQAKDEDGKPIFNRYGGLYTTYFDSTKTNSNAFIGALGLGSKSPFSYTKSFEVISRFNGWRMIYAVFINEQGVPTIAKMGELPTDEINGLEVKFVVNSSDFYSFQGRAEEVLRWFKVQPIVKGVSKFNVRTVKPSKITNKHWFIVDKNDTTFRNRNKVVAVQGNVEYRVDYTSIDKLTPSDIFLLKIFNIVMFFDIGDLEVAASREEIRYDERTQHAIYSRLKSILDTVSRFIEKTISKYDTVWDAYIGIDQLAKTIFPFSRLNDFITFVKNRQIANKFLQSYIHTNGILNVLRYTAHEIHEYSLTSGVTRISRTSHIKKIKPTEDTVVFVNDAPRGGVARLTNFLTSNSKYSSAIVIVPYKNPKKLINVADPHTDTMTTHLVDADEKYQRQEYKELIEDIGNPKVLSIDKDTSKAVTTLKSKVIFTFNGMSPSNYGRPVTPHWKRVRSVNIDDGGVYFHLLRGNTITYQGHSLSWGVNTGEYLKIATTLVNEHYGLKIIPSDIHGVGSTELKHFTSNEKWKNFFDLLTGVLESFTEQIVAVRKWHKVPDDLGIIDSIKHSRLHAYVDKLDKTSKFRKFVDEIKKVNKETETFRVKSNEFLSLFAHTIQHPINEKVDKLVKVDYTDVLTQYPMLSLFVRSLNFSDSQYYKTSDEKLTEVFNYIKLVDRSNQ